MYLQTILPFGFYAQQGEENDISLGNIYAGVQFKLGRKALSRFSAGMYIPTAPSYDSENKMGNAMALLSNIYNIERYTSESFSIYTNYAYVVSPGKGPLFTFEAGPSVVMPTGKSAEYREVELYLHYGVKGGFQWNMVAVWAELNGLLAATSGATSAGEATIHQMFLGVQFTGALVRPGIFYGISLDKDRNDFTESKGMLGIKVDVVLNRSAQM
jgi:hypothetical protein